MTGCAGNIKYVVPSQTNYFSRLRLEQWLVFQGQKAYYFHHIQSKGVNKFSV